MLMRTYDHRFSKLSFSVNFLMLKLSLEQKIQNKLKHIIIPHIFYWHVWKKEKYRFLLLSICINTSFLLVKNIHICIATSSFQSFFAREYFNEYEAHIKSFSKKNFLTMVISECNVWLFAILSIWSM